MVPEAKSSLNKYFIIPGTYRPGTVVSVEDNSTNTEKYFLSIVLPVLLHIVPYR